MSVLNAFIILLPRSMASNKLGSFIIWTKCVCVSPFSPRSRERKKIEKSQKRAKLVHPIRHIGFSCICENVDFFLRSCCPKNESKPTNEQEWRKKNLINGIHQIYMPSQRIYFPHDLHTTKKCLCALEWRYTKTNLVNFMMNFAKQRKKNGSQFKNWRNKSPEPLLIVRQFFPLYLRQLWFSMLV